VGPRDDRGPEGPYDITIIQLFDAPRELVFRQWIDAADLGTWFAPDDCTVTSCEVDVRPSGKWRVEYRCGFGGAYAEYGEFHEIVPPERLTFSLTQEDDKGAVGPRTRITVSFAEVDGKTRMTFTQTGFTTAKKRDSHTEGWNECFRKLAGHMASAVEIRAVIERWAGAVQRQDVETILAHHTADFLMFDVPPPTELRGIEAYRESWAPFFGHFKHGGVFAIARLDVTAGDRVAFATALLRCGTEEELREKPTSRLRLTIGLRKERDRWMIAHEHHSYPLE
jgi:uncharacterized protein (TIGR02246 family)